MLSQLSFRMTVIELALPLVLALPLTLPLALALALALALLMEDMMVTSSGGADTCLYVKNYPNPNPDNLGQKTSCCPGT